MNIGTRLGRLERRLKPPSGELSDAQRHHQRLLANVTLATHPDLVLVERHDCVPGEMGLRDYLRVREVVLWTQGNDVEAERMHNELRQREERVHASGDEALDQDAREDQAVKRALKRLGRQPTPPRLRDPATATAEEQFSELEREAKRRLG